MRTPDDGIRYGLDPKTGKWGVIESFDFRGISHVSMPWSWLEICSRLPGKALTVALLICLQKDLTKNSVIKLPGAALSRLQIGKVVLHRALRQLQVAGLITYTPVPGRKSIITIIDPEGKLTSAERSRRRKIRVVGNRDLEGEA